MTVSLDKLDRALNKSRQSFIQVCSTLEIDPESISMDKLLNCRCVNCGIWGNRFTEMIDDELCLFCSELETLRF